MEQTERSDPARQKGEHILICLSPEADNARVIRAAAQMAAAFSGTLTALYVQSSGSGRMHEKEQARLRENVQLAESRGAIIATVMGEYAAFQIAEFTRLSKVTKLLIGRSSRQEKELADRLLEQSCGAEIFILPGTMQNGKPLLYSPGRSRPAPLLQWGTVLLMLAVTTLIGWAFWLPGFTEANIVTVYILGVLLSALLTKSYPCSIVSSLGSVLLFNYFFTEPRLTFHAYESGDLVTLAVMLTASLLTGTLANRQSENARHSAEAAARTKILFETNQLLQQARDDRELFSVTARQLLKLLDRDVAVYPVVKEQLHTGQTFRPDGHGDVPAFTADESILLQVMKSHQRQETDGGAYLPLVNGGRIFGVVGIGTQGCPLEPFEQGILGSILGECALTMENRRIAREKEEAALLAQNEHLRANLLRTISHDLRTPLTAISGNAENLLSNDVTLNAPSQRTLLQDIYDDSIWLIELVENLLSITRIGQGAAHLRLVTQLVDEVIAAALQHVSRKARAHCIIVEESDEILLAQMDARLISQVIINLVDNAIKYTPAGSVIRIGAAREGAMVAIRVSDNGPGIPDEHKARVFDRFFTGNTQVADCRRSLGLGLPLCRSIISVHGGTSALTDNVPTGCIFTLTLPASEVSTYE